MISLTWLWFCSIQFSDDNSVIVTEIFMDAFAAFKIFFEFFIDVANVVRLGQDRLVLDELINTSIKPQISFEWWNLFYLE